MSSRHMAGRRSPTIVCSQAVHAVPSQVQAGPHVTIVDNNSVVSGGCISLLELCYKGSTNRSQRSRNTLPCPPHGFHAFLDFLDHDPSFRLLHTRP